jgi:hypothetical protein
MPGLEKELKKMWIHFTFTTSLRDPSRNKEENMLGAGDSYL